jgi:hypothetical protein
MTTQSLQREQMILEMLHEKNQIILNLNAQVQNLTARVEALEKEKKGAEDR